MKKTIWIFLLCFVLILLIPIIYYIILFHSHPISSNPNDLNSFGGYIGGVVGVIVGIANILVLIYLTWTVSDLDEKRNLRELRIMEIKELSRMLDDIPSMNDEHMKNESLDLAKIKVLDTRHRVSSFSRTTRQLLFEEANMSLGKVLLHSLTNIVTVYDEYKLNVTDRVNATEIVLKNNKKACERRIFEKISSFNEHKEEFLKDLIIITRGSDRNINL